MSRGLKKHLTKIRERLKKKEKEKNFVLLDVRHKDNITFQLRGVKCGKCPKIHSSYWYAFYRDGSGKVRTKYIGKKLHKEKVNTLIKELERIRGYDDEWIKFKA